MTATGNNRNKMFLSLLCIAITIAFLFAGLWPFNFRPKNDVTWLNGQNGIHFGRQGIAYSASPLYGPQEALRPCGSVSIEVVVRPSEEPANSIARILTLYGGETRHFFTLAQWKSYLILRTASRGNDLHRDFREMGAGEVLSKNTPRFLTITSENGNTAIYADGSMLRSTDNFPILPKDPSVSGDFVLGNSPAGDNPWTGDLLFLAVYDRELSAEEVKHHFQGWVANGTPTWLPGKTPTLLYRFNERMGTTSRNYGEYLYPLRIPPIFHVLQKNILRPPWKEEFHRRSFIRDVVVNILGFLPLGFFLAARLKKPKQFQGLSDIFLVAALGGGISLAIELLQVFLPSRTSSLTDVFCNISGTILGAYLYRAILFILRIEDRTYR